MTLPFAPTRRAFIQSSLAAAGAFVGLPAHTAPAAAGHVFYGYPPGSIGALVGGLVLKEMQGRYQPDLGLDLNFVPGNTAARSIDAVHRAEADGGTVLYSPSTVLTLSSHIRALPGIDVAKDFVAVAPLVEFTFAFTVGPAVPAEVRTLKDYLRWVRDNPMQGGYGLPGLGTAPHFVGMALARTADVPIRPVAYQGTAPMAKDLYSGGVPAAMMLLHGRDLKADSPLRPLAVASAQRWPTMPDLPTLRELGAADVDVTETFGFHVRSATPATKVEAMSEAVRDAVRSPQLAALVAGSLLRTVQTTPQIYAGALAEERHAWAGIVKRERFTMQS